MNDTIFIELQKEIQEIIDFIAIKQIENANIKLIATSQKLDTLIDHVSDDENLIQISKYQVLLNKLQQQIIKLSPII